MPTYDFICKSSSNPHEFELFMTFKEYDGCNGRVVCKECGAPAFIAITTAPHGHVTNNDNLGKIAENNAKKFGKYGVEDRTLAEEKRRKPKPKLSDKHWWGNLGAEKTKNILGETDSKKRAKKIKDYVIDGKG